MLPIGIVFALLSAVLFGASTPFAKLLLGTVDPWLLAGLLYLGAGLGLGIVHVSRGLLRLPTIETPLRRSDVPWLAAVVASGGIAGPLLLMFGLARTEAAGASLLLNLEGLATMGIAWVVFRENVDKRLLLGAFAILLGAVLLSWQGRAVFDWGAVLIAGACLAWGIDNNLTRKLSSADPVQIAMVKGLVAGTVNLSLALCQGASLPGITTILAASGVGFLGYGVSLVLFVLGLRHLGTARTGAYFSLAPFIGAVLAILTKAPPAVPVTELTIIPGRTRRQVNTLLKAQGVSGSYYAASRRSRALNPAAYGAPRGTDSLEAFLFPATYQLCQPARLAALVADPPARPKLDFSTSSLPYASRHQLTSSDVLTILSML